MEPIHREANTVLVPWRVLPRPIDWAARFGRDAPLDVEIGFGNGAYLVERAAAMPERNHVGIEVSWGSVHRGLRRVRAARASHVRLLYVDAAVAFERLFPPRSVARVDSNFPCPWPKARHERHRLFARPLLRRIAAALLDGGTLRVVTDHDAYRDWLLDEVEDSGFSVRVRDVPAELGTKYERKWAAQGQERFFAVEMVKQAHPDLRPREDVALVIHQVDRFDPETFDPPECHGEIAVVPKAFLYDPNRRKAMLRVIVAEAGLTQDLWILVAAREDGWKIRPAEGCGMLPTPGLQCALDAVRDAIVAQCTG